MLIAPRVVIHLASYPLLPTHCFIGHIQRVVLRRDNLSTWRTQRRLLPLSKGPAIPPDLDTELRTLR